MGEIDPSLLWNPITKGVFHDGFHSAALLHSFTFRLRKIFTLFVNGLPPLLPVHSRPRDISSIGWCIGSIYETKRSDGWWLSLYIRRGCLVIIPPQAAMRKSLLIKLCFGVEWKDILPERPWNRRFPLLFLMLRVIFSHFAFSYYICSIEKGGSGDREISNIFQSAFQHWM